MTMPQLSTSNTKKPKRPSKVITIHIVVIAMVWGTWLFAMIETQQFDLFVEKGFMTITMLFGSFMAGATSEGGGAIAFPVMTLLFDIQPHVARDFSLMIQSVGMSAAALTIFVLGIPVEYRALIFSGLGGIVGIITGLKLLAPLFPAAFTKTFFLSLWLSFAVALYWINRDANRQVFTRIKPFNHTHAVILFLVGFIGGIVSGLTGTGLDILTFAVLTLMFAINEKVATPTSVILMAGNSLVGFTWQSFSAGGVAETAWPFWWVSVPVVVIGAPLGAWFIQSRSRIFVTYLLYFSILLQYFAGLVLIPQTWALLLFNMSVLIGGLCLFRFFYYSGFHLSFSSKI